MKITSLRISTVCFVLLTISCKTARLQKDEYTNALDYCVAQASKTAKAITDYSKIPRSIANGRTEWRTVNYTDWTAGFWPGIEWYLYEYTKDNNWKERADKTQNTFAKIVDSAAIDHDM